MGESQSNGIIERAVGLVAGQARTLKAALGHRTRARVPPDARILCWLVEFAIEHSVDYHSADGIVTPLPDSDLDDAQLHALLVSPLYLQEREANAERSQVYHFERENLMSSSSQDPISTRKLVALFSSQKRLNQDTFSYREVP